MRSLCWLVTGALGLSACVARADTITINPSNFASGQYVSYATPGVTLSTMTLVPVGTPYPDEIQYGPNLGPVYSYEGTFTSGPLGDNGWGFLGLNTYGLQFSITTCLEGCISGPNANNGQWLMANFSAPVNFVSVLQYDGEEEASEIAAFDSSGTLVGSCIGWNGEGFQPSIAPPCSSQGLTRSGDGQTYLNPAVSESVLNSSDDITTVLIGSVDGGGTNKIGAIEFGDVPEPATFALMSLGLLGLAWSQRRRLVRRI